MAKAGIPAPLTHLTLAFTWTRFVLFAYFDYDSHPVNCVS
jgi:hypothetical protein